jgi:hypothetical protein
MRRLADALAPARLHTLLIVETDERIRQVDDPLTAASHTVLGCPFCEVHQHTDHNSGVTCLSCKGFLSEGLLQALRRVPDLPEILPRSSPGAPARGASTRRRDASSSFSGSQPQVSVRDAENPLYGVA